MTKKEKKCDLIVTGIFLLVHLYCKLANTINEIHTFVGEKIPKTM